MYICVKTHMGFWNIKDARLGLYIDRGLQAATKRLKLGVVSERRRWERTIFHSRTVFLKVMSRLNRLVHWINVINIYSCTSQVAIPQLLYLA